jgi:predicted DNA-binding protein
MVGVRLPRKMLKKIAKLADALSADRSTAIREILEWGLDSGQAIGLLRSGKGRGRAGEIAVLAMAELNASKAAEHATRAVPADKHEAEIKALRAAEHAAELVSNLGDKLAREQSEKSKNWESVSTPGHPSHHSSRFRSPRF